ncbi:putative SANT/Myb domain, Homeobox-like domain superfamily, Helicase/SANT-associated [Plasmopara halstedii]
MQHLEPTKASYKNDSISSTAVLCSIRERLAEYNEALLRQLVDERKAAQKIVNDQDVGENYDNRLAEKEIDKKTHGESEVKASERTEDRSHELQKVARETENECFLNENVAKDESMLTKRKLAEDSHQHEEDIAANKKTKINTAVIQNVTAVGICQKDDDETTIVAIDGAQQPEDNVDGATSRVVRMSAPPSKYFIQKKQQEEATNREYLSQKKPITLLASPNRNTSKEDMDVKQPPVSSQNHLVSKISTDADFESTLREYVCLQRKIHKRGLAVTRKRQLPRLTTPLRGKSHWDFLLEEMKWLATDFAHERNWKRVVQHRLATDAIVAQNADNMRLEQANRRLARGVALQISAFWRTMERIAARSRARFEPAGSDSSYFGDTLASTRGKNADDDGKRDKSEDLDMGGTDESALTLKFFTGDTNTSKSEGRGEDKPEAIALAKSRLTYIVSAGKRARSAMTSSSVASTDSGKSSIWSFHEAAFRDLQARCTASQAKKGSAIILAAFQLVALRWMLDLYSSGLNMFLNDQLGMGKATTIVAFLSLIEIITAQKQQQHRKEGGVSKSDDASVSELKGPHLIIVSGEELHKWQYFLRIWHPGRRIQHYDGASNSQAYREKLQREWKTKPRANARKNNDDFIISVSNDDDDDEELDDDERIEPVYCVLCPVCDFAEDREAFVAFKDWQMVIIENEHNQLFDDLTCVSAIQQLRQQQRRVLCNSQSIENWTNSALRLRYAEFLIEGVSCSNDDDEIKGSDPTIQSWPVQELLVEKASVVEVLQHYGKSSNVRTSLWKSCSQDESSKYINALLFALSCLSLRRVRSEVEPELGKIEEISVSCQLTSLQKTQYRNVLNGFVSTLDTSSGREERLSVWLQLLLRLREICNCVDIVNDMDKLGHADLRLLMSCSAKLETLEPLLRRLTLQEGKKVVIYSQFNTMLPILELYLSLLNISCVRVTGSVTMQRRALCHFADRPVIRVALVSTRLSTSTGKRAVSVFGGEAIIVVDSDWNAICDAKLRASWAKLAVGGAESLPVYRMHCENTIEASLLRVGASLTEKAFGEMSPPELFAVPSDMSLRWTVEKPSWWSSTTTSSGGVSSNMALAKLPLVAQQVEKEVKYCGNTNELEAPLNVYDVDLDAEEHLLLANTDELTPVEWYAVNFVHGANDNKLTEVGKNKTTEIDANKSSKDEGPNTWNESNTFVQSDEHSFEKLASLEIDRQWQDGDAASTLFFHIDSHKNGKVCETALEKLYMQMRMEGMETHFDVYKPPEPPASKISYLSSEIASSGDSQMTYRAIYRVPAPPPPAPLQKFKLEQTAGHHEDLLKYTKSNKKQRANLAAARAGMASISSTKAGGSSGVKRKLESQLSGLKTGHKKEMRVDLEGIPVPDVSEFADDDFWGDSNLDALDSAEWDDPALLGSILGVGVGVGSAASQLGTGTREGTLAMSGASGGAGNANNVGGHLDPGHLKTGAQKSSKKSKTGTGKARKSSMSFSDSGRDAWSVQDDIILRKLFELYGANWTLIAQVLNSSAAVSRFVNKKRSPRQCYDRYGKLMSGAFATSGTLPTTIAKDTKSGSSSKAQRAAAIASMAATQLTPAILDARIGLPSNELLIEFPHRHSLPGLPPPSITVDMTSAHRKAQALANSAAGKHSYVGVDELKSIKTSFDAIIQCMKHKTSPPPIPIPAGVVVTPFESTATSSGSTSSTQETKASLTAASFHPTQSPLLASKSPPVAITPTKGYTKVSINASGSPTTTAKAMPLVVPPPHKSHTDMISLLPMAVLGPDEVIKRSKEAAVVAVQTAAAVASVGRDGSPLSASGDVMLGAGSGFDASVNGSMPRRSHAASLTTDLNSVAAIPPSSIPVTVSTTGTSVSTSGASPSLATTATWGGNVGQANGLNSGASIDFNGAPGTRSNDLPRAPVPVTTSTLLHVLDRMPEIKNKIQSILNRTDCSESQKVAMIARLLSNTNAIHNTNVQPPASSSNSAVLSVLTADTSLLSSSDMLIDTETPIPMPASLATPISSNVPSSSAPAPQEQFRPPSASSQP